MRCPRCGGENDNRSLYCILCGQELPRSDREREQAPAEPQPPLPSTAAPSPPRTAPLPGTAQRILASSPAPEVPSHLVWSVLTTILCCNPLGIVAIVFSALVGSRLAAGRIEAAMRASRTAATLCWVAAASSLLALLILLGQLL